MATKRQKKKAYNTAKKVAKKNPNLFIALILIVILIAGGVFAYLYFSGNLNKFLNKDNNTNNNTNTNQNVPLSVNGEVQIYSIEMHDEYGDALFIKYKDYDVLIDSGNYGDAEYVRNFVDSNISSDKNLDLLIVTHCHADHLGGITNNGPRALDNVKSISNIIDFGHTRSNDPMYNNYATIRKKYLDAGTKYYPAYESVKHVDGLDNKIIFEDLSIEILDTFNYASKDTDLINHDKDSIPFNEYSIATLITYKDTKLFCAGDLEDKGEKTLIEHSSETSLKDVKKEDTVIYKACHHGTDVGSANSKKNGATSTNGGNRMALLQLLNPDYCFVSSAIAESDHPYPRAIATMLYFTDNVYFNGTMGTICFDLDGINVGVQGVGATTNYKLDGFAIDYAAEKNYKYTETTWYKNHVFKGAKSWYTGDIQNPTDKQLTEWYLEKLKADYPQS